MRRLCTHPCAYNAPTMHRRCACYAPISSSTNWVTAALNMPSPLRLLLSHQDKEVRPKVMRQIPKVLTDVMPIVGVRPKSGIPEPATHVKVTVTVDLR